MTLARKDLYFNPKYVKSRKELEKFKKDELIAFIEKEYFELQELQATLRSHIDRIKDVDENDLGDELTNALTEIETLKKRIEGLEEETEEQQNTIDLMDEKFNLDQIEDLLDSLTVQYRHRFDSSQLSSLALNIPIIKQIIRFGSH